MTKLWNFNTTPCYGSTSRWNKLCCRYIDFNTTPCYGSTENLIDFTRPLTPFQYNSLLRFNSLIGGIIHAIKIISIQLLVTVQLTMAEGVQNSNGFQYNSLLRFNIGEKSLLMDYQLFQYNSLLRFNHGAVASGEGAHAFQYNSLLRFNKFCLNCYTYFILISIQLLVTVQHETDIEPLLLAFEFQYNSLLRFNRIIHGAWVGTGKFQYNSLLRFNDNRLDLLWTTLVHFNTTPCYGSTFRSSAYSASVFISIQLLVTVQLQQYRC